MAWLAWLERRIRTTESAMRPARRGVVEIGGILVIQWNTEGGSSWGGSRRKWVNHFSQSFGGIKKSIERWGGKGPYLPFFTASLMTVLYVSSPLGKLELVRDQVWGRLLIEAVRLHQGWLTGDEQKGGGLQMILRFWVTESKNSCSLDNFYTVISTHYYF